MRTIYDKGQYNKVKHFNSIYHINPVDNKSVVTIQIELDMNIKLENGKCGSYSKTIFIRNGKFSIV